MKPNETWAFFVALCIGVTWNGALAAAQAAPSETHTPPLRQVTICIDPGHPSEVGRGTSGRHITEIAVAWQVAQRMKADLQAAGVHVVMTKSGEDEFVTNRQRAETANAAHAELMVRLHCDGGNGIGSGLAVYYPDRQGHAADGKVGPSAAVIAAGSACAHVFYTVVASELHGDLAARGLHADTATRIGGIQGALTGSIYSRVPVLLVEMCVLTNPHDEAWISSPDGQKKMAQALADGALKAVAR